MKYPLPLEIVVCLICSAFVFAQSNSSSTELTQEPPASGSSAQEPKRPHASTAHLGVLRNPPEEIYELISMICLLLCTAVMAGGLDVRAAHAAAGQTPVEPLHVPELVAGFHLLYELKFEEARNQFKTWQKSHPEDPLGSASEAAAYLFEECYRQGVLTSEFFLDNKRFLGKIPLTPDPKLRAAFFAADKQAQDLAQLRLKTNPDDTNTLFAMTLSLGMLADYASLIDKHQLESLQMIGEADKYAKKLLAVAPDAADAYLGLGTANYIIGSLPGLKRFFLGIAGIHGDKKVGIQQLQIAADRGHYLRPFAKIMLALAALREKQPEVARAQFKELVAEFPENPLFVNELAKLKVSSAAAIPTSIVNSPSRQNQHPSTLREASLEVTLGASEPDPARHPRGDTLIPIPESHYWRVA